jgi:G:T-mismatch repair DNA endonuclease (very short patch repair protein)
MKRHPPIALTCERCGLQFNRRFSYHRYLTEKRGVKHAFCSRACKDRFEERAVYDDIADDYQRGLTLEEIANSHKVSAEAIRRRLIREGVTLRPRWHPDRNQPTKGRGHTTAARMKISAATRKQFSNPAARALAAHNQRQAMAAGKFPSVSKIEAIVAQEFTRRGIYFRSQAAIRDPQTGLFCACVDFLLAGNVVIEVNGTYWHADPRNYPDGPVHESQKRTAEKYAKKLTALQRLRYTVLEIWEREIRSDVVAAVAAVLP